MTGTNLGRLTNKIEEIEERNTRVHDGYETDEETTDYLWQLDLAIRILLVWNKLEEEKRVSMSDLR